MSLSRTLLFSSFLLSFAVLAGGGALIAVAQEQPAPDASAAGGRADAEEVGDIAATEDVEGDGLSDAAGSPFYARFPTVAAYLESVGMTPPTEDDDAREEIGLRLLFQVERLADERLAAWVRLENHAAPYDPASLPPFAALNWSGIVERVEEIEPNPDLYLDIPTAYVLHVRPEGESSADWRILVARAPKAWLAGSPNVEASGNAVFLRKGEDGDDAVVWAVGDLPIWRPTSPDEALGVTPSQVSLADAGMNLAELDGLRTRDKAEFAVADREPFFAMLRATEVATPAERRELAQEVTLVDLLTKSDRFVGEAVRFPARVRRITEIRIEDSRVVRALGRETYWQLDCVYDLGDQPIRMRGREGEDIVFRRTFPATVCTLDLPDEMKEERNRSLDRGGQGEVNRRVDVEGYFFRLWAFPTEQTREAGTDALQFGPLAIGTIETVQPPEFETSWIYWFLLPGAFVVGGLLIYLWQATRGDSVTERVRQARMEREANVVDLKGIPTRPVPDFSRLSKKPSSDEGSGE